MLAFGWKLETSERNQFPQKGVPCGVQPHDGTLDLQGLVEHISDHKRTKRTHAEREDRFRGIFEENGSVMLLVEPHSAEIVDANPAASANYG